MTKKIKINNVEVSIEDFKKAMEENKELLEKKSGKVERVKDQKYYYANCYGVIEDSNEDFNYIDNYRYLTGNYFLTKKKAEDYKAYLEALGRVNHAILEANDGWEPNWSVSHENKNYIELDRTVGVLYVNWCCEAQKPFNLDFIKTSELAESIIKTHKEDLLLIFNYKQ